LFIFAKFDPESTSATSVSKNKDIGALRKEVQAALNAKCGY
jgi:hypothetical protein